MTDKPYGQHLDPLWDRLAENNGRMKAILDFGVLASKTKNHASGFGKPYNALLDSLAQENIRLLNELADRQHEL